MLTGSGRHRYQRTIIGLGILPISFRKLDQRCPSAAGRHSEADLRMPLPDVSRRHCRFVHSQAGWELIDLGSLNGVYVNGARVERAMLHPGDSVRICSLEFEVETPDRPASVETLSQAIHGLAASSLAPERKSA